MVFLEHVALLVGGLAGFAIWPNIRPRVSTEPSGTANGIPCNFRQQTVSRSNQVTVTVQIPCDERFEFTLRRENVTDRIAKALRLVREFQTQDERFDEAVYIGADESGFDEWLAEDPEARKEFLDLLALEPQEYTRVTRINASRGTLTLSALAKPPMFQRAPSDLALTVAQASVAGLKACCDRLQAFASSRADPSAFLDPYAVRIRTLSSLTLGLFIVPFVLVFFLLRLQAPRVEFATNAFADRYVFEAMGAVLCVLIVVTLVLLGRSARLHMVLLPLLFSGAIGTVFAAPAFIREVNADWDQSAPHRYPATVLYRHATHGRSSAYYLWLSDWHSRSDHRELRVDAATFNELTEGDTVTVSEREGYLGRPWISDFSRDVPQ